MTSHYAPTPKKGLLARWRYQYEVTFGLYMLTPIEKVVVDFTVISMAILLSFAIYTSMPSHASFVVSRFWFYVTGTVEGVAHNVGLHTNHLKTTMQDTPTF